MLCPHAVLFKVYCSDHTYTTIRVPMAASVREVISAVADKLGSAEDLLLVNLSSAGGEKGHSYTLIKRWWLTVFPHMACYLQMI